MRDRPIIGVLPLWDDEKNSYWMLPGYLECIISAGGLPIMLPLTEDKEMIDRISDMCSGFLFTGGHDVSPEVYGETARYDNIGCCKRRDNMELYLLKEALIREKAVLGICRGIQFINAAMGGTLYQDIPLEHPSDIEHHQSPPYDMPVHSVMIENGSPLHKILHTNQLDVNSYHHQAVKSLAPPLRAMAHSEDGIIEAVYMPSRKFVWAVQWHPEFSYLSEPSSMLIVEEFIKHCT